MANEGRNSAGERALGTEFWQARFGHVRARTSAAGAMEHPGDGTAMFSDCIALAFFAHIVRAYGSVAAEGWNARGGLASWQLQRAREFINANLADDPSISELANACGLSPSYFARAFKQTTGVPPYRWLTKQRVARAKDLLQEPGRELADIAQLCGFVDQSHFRVFQKRGYSLGVAPPSRLTAQ